MPRLGSPVESPARGLLGPRQGGADHHCIGAAGDGLEHIAGAPNRAVGDHVHVPSPGLVKVVAPGSGDIGHRGGHRNGDTQHGPRRMRRAATEPDQHPGGSGAHQVQSGLVRGASSDDDGHIELVDEPLEIERLRVTGDVLGGDGRTPDDEQVDSGIHHDLGELLGALRRQSARHGHTRIAHLLQPRRDELLLDRLRIDLLQSSRGLRTPHLGHLVEQRLGGLVPRPQTFEVEYAESAELAKRDGGVG